MSLLNVQGLQKIYDSFQLKDISFSLPKGFIMGYIGENGAGKTTTLNLITHLCHADSGTISIDGLQYETDPKKYIEQIGFIGDQSYFPGEFRLKDIRFLLKLMYPSFQKDKFDAMAANWKLPEKTKIQDYSRGMKVKLMFASVLSRDTKLLILDEATNGLDPVMRAEIIDMLQDYIMDGERSNSLFDPCIKRPGTDSRLYRPDPQRQNLIKSDKRGTSGKLRDCSRSFIRSDRSEKRKNDRNHRSRLWI